MKILLGKIIRFEEESPDALWIDEIGVLEFTKDGDKYSYIDLDTDTMEKLRDLLIKELSNA